MDLRHKEPLRRIRLLQVMFVHSFVNLTISVRNIDSIVIFRNFRGSAAAIMGRITLQLPEVIRVIFHVW